MKTPGKFNTRAFVALMVALSGLGLPLTGLFNHWLGQSPMSVERHAWMSAHNVLGLLFLVFSIWHVLLNRRSLWKHVRRSTAQLLSLNRETVVAGAVVAFSLLLSVGHVFVLGG